jgi:predicted nucleic acid-binding protein
VGIAYIDSSALLKLIVREDETAALETDLAGRDGLVTSTLAVVECRRAVRRGGPKRLLQQAEEVFEIVYLVDMTRPILERAAALEPALVRSLDAIHVATALSVGDPGLEVLTYDDRMAEAAQAGGLRVLQPGKASAASASRAPASARRARRR